MLSTTGGVAFWQPAPLQTLAPDVEEPEVTRVPGTGVVVVGLRRVVDFDDCDEVAFVGGLERRDCCVDVESVLVCRVLEDLVIEDLIVCVVVRVERLLLAVVDFGLDFVATAVVVK